MKRMTWVCISSLPDNSVLLAHTLLVTCDMHNISRLPQYPAITLNNASDYRTIRLTDYWANVGGDVV